MGCPPVCRKMASYVTSSSFSQWTFFAVWVAICLLFELSIECDPQGTSVIWAGSLHLHSPFGCQDVIPSLEVNSSLRVWTLHGSTFILKDRVQQDVSFGDFILKSDAGDLQDAGLIGWVLTSSCKGPTAYVISLSVSRVALWETDAHHVFPASLTMFWAQVIFFAVSLSAPRILCLYIVLLYIQALTPVSSILYPQCRFFYSTFQLAERC